MRNIYLYGALANKLGPVFELDVDTPMEAFRFLGVQIEEFRELVSKSVFKILRGNGDQLSEVTEDALSFPLGSANDLHIVPVVAGGGRAGKAIIGAVVMVVAVVGAAYTGGASTSLLSSMSTGAAFGLTSAFTWGNMFAVGLMLTLSGVSQMLAPSPNLGGGSRESADQRASFFLGGQVNQVQQGGPVPIVYGRVRVGSHVISAGLTTEQM